MFELPRAFHCLTTLLSWGCMASIENYVSMDVIKLQVEFKYWFWYSIIICTYE